MTSKTPWFPDTAPPFRAGWYEQKDVPGWCSEDPPKFWWDGITWRTRPDSTRAVRPTPWRGLSSPARAGA